MANKIEAEVMLRKLEKACRAHTVAMFRYSLGKLTERQVDAINVAFLDATFAAGRYLAITDKGNESK